MENKLELLFDYQRFEASPRLAKLIAQTEARSSRRQLSDEELEFLSAAGTWAPVGKDDNPFGDML